MMGPVLQRGDVELTLHKKRRSKTFHHQTNGGSLKSTCDSLSTLLKRSKARSRRGGEEGGYLGVELIDLVFWCGWLWAGVGLTKGG